MICAAHNRHTGVGNSHSLVVVNVYSDLVAENACNVLYNFGYFIGKGSAVGVAQHKRVRSGFACRPERAHCIFTVVLAAVKKMLGIKENSLSLALQISHGVGNHIVVCLTVRAENLGDVQIPALAENSDGRRVCRQQGRKIFVLGGGAVLAACASESYELGIFKRYL